MKHILEPVSGRKRMIVTFKQKDLRKNKEEDKTSILQKSVEPRLRFLDVVKVPGGFAAPHDPEGLTAFDINDYQMPTLFATLTDNEIASLSKDPNVAQVEPDGIVHALDMQFAQTPPGSGIIESSLVTSKGTGGPSALADSIPWGISTVGAPSCWEATQGRGIYVAVIDSGIAPHDDLTGNLLGGVSFVPGETWVDGLGHGTHVSGTIAARINGIGVVGVAPAAYLYAIKVLDHTGSGAWSWLMSGLYWMRYYYGSIFDVANMSMGGDSAPSALEAYINYAAQTTLLIAAAGNSGGAVGYPAKYPACVAVSAIDSSNTIAGFSSRGPEVALCAPGVNVYSTLPGNNYGYYSGTSMATPHVTGAAALCRGTHRYSPISDIRAILTTTATDLGPAGKDDLYGYGRVNCVGATFSAKK